MSVPTARDLMTDRVLAVQADMSLQELAAFLTDHEISGAPVISGYGNVIGVVSVTDIARNDSDIARGSEEQEEPPSYFLGDAATKADKETLKAVGRRPEATVRDVMMPALFTVEEDAPIYEVADRMLRGHLHRLLVVRSGTKRDIVGIVSSMDLLEWIRGQKPSES